MGGDFDISKDKRDKRDDRDKKEKDRKRDRSREHKDKERKRDRDESRERDRKDKDRKDKEDKKDKSRRTEDKDKDRERRRDRSRDREQEKDGKREKDKKGEIKEKTDKKEKTNKNLDLLFGEKVTLAPITSPSSAGPIGFGVGGSQNAPTKVAPPPPSITVEGESGPIVVTSQEDLFDHMLGKQLTYKPIVITIGGKPIALPATAASYLANCPSATEYNAMIAAAPLTSIALLAAAAAAGNSSGGSNAAMGGALDGVSGALIAASAALLNTNATIITTEQVRNARENRRMHVTGFPRLTPKEYLQRIIEERFVVYRKEIIARTAGIPVEDLPENCECNIDRVMEVFLENQKEKPFAFIEVNTDDMVDMFITPINITNRPIYIPLQDGTNASLNFGRPRDFKKVSIIDPSRVLIQGIPLQFDSDKMRTLVAKYAGETVTAPTQAAGGDSSGATTSATVVKEEDEESGKNKILLNFAMSEGIAYAELADEEAAAKVIKGLNGKALSRRLMSAQPLSEVMRAFCIAMLGFNIPYKEIEMMNDDKNEKEDTVLMELLKITSRLPQVMCKLGDYYEHLKPLFGSIVPVYPTRILVLLNIVDDTDLDTDESYGKLCENVAIEVEKYGRVKNLIIPRLEPPPPPMFVRKQIEKPTAVSMLPVNNPFDPQTAAALGITIPKTKEEILYEEEVKKQDELEAAYHKAMREYPAKHAAWERAKDHPIYGCTGRIYVEYETAQEALNAQQGLAGKLYCNRTVVTSFLFEDILYPPEPEIVNKEEAPVANAENNASAATDEAPVQCNDNIPKDETTNDPNVHIGEVATSNNGDIGELD